MHVGLKQREEIRRSHHDVDDSRHLSESLDGPVYLYAPAKSPYGSGVAPASDDVALATAAEVDVDEACAIAAAAIMAL